MSEIANTEQHEAWNGEGGLRWVEDADRRDQVLAPVADALLAAAGLTAGERVIDVGCGCGATTLAAARTVAGTGGAVYGVDLSEPMLAVARQRVAAAEVENVVFVQADVQTHRFPSPAEADVAISRFGTMFFGDQVAALANLRTGLKPGGRLCLATWQPLEANDWLSVPGAPLPRYGAHLDAGSPMFSQSDTATVTATLDAAGYTDPRLEPVTVDFVVGTDIDNALAYFAGVGIGRMALAEVPDDQRPAALDDIRAAIADHASVGADGAVHLPGGIWIVTARNPA